MSATISATPAPRPVIALFAPFFLLLSLTIQAQPTSAERIQSPIIGEDRVVTFSVRAPEATQVRLASSGDIAEIPFGQSMDMEKDSEGVWQLSIGPIAPGSYRYNFNIDGVAVLDPVNPVTSASNDNPWSLLHIPGSAFMDANRVPHGAVAEVTYYSNYLGRDRRMHVYTPPGFETSDRDYPVFYLLHGAMDSDDSWSTVGRAGFILDNLIAEGKAEPMIVVMPHGHTRSFTMGQSELPIEDFVEEFQTDIKPYIEGHYPVIGSRDKTAIAGLSMGGAHTLEIAFNSLQHYAYVGVYSSGVFGITEGDDWQQAHREALHDDSLREGLELLWFATGSEDFLLETTVATVDMLSEHDFEVEYVESEGGHTWINWREYLHTFAQKLFR